MKIRIEPPTEIEALWEAEPDIGNGPEMSLRKIVRRHYMLSHGIAEAEERAETYLCALAASIPPAPVQMTGWKNEHCNGEPEVAEIALQLHDNSSANIQMSTSSAYDCPHCGIDRDPCYSAQSMSHRAEQGDVDCRKALATTVTPAGQRILDRHYPSDRLYKNQYDGTFRWDREGDGESKRAVEKLIEVGLLTLHPVGTGGVTSLSAVGMALVSKRVRGNQPV